MHRGGRHGQHLAHCVLIVQEAALPQLLLQQQPLVPGEVILAPGADREQRLEDVRRGGDLEQDEVMRSSSDFIDEDSTMSKLLYQALAIESKGIKKES